MVENLIRALLLPSNLVVVLFVAGLLLLLFARLRSRSGVLFGAAILVYTVFGSGPVAFSLIGSLEYRYPALDAAVAADPTVSDIVILTGYAEADPRIPQSSELNAASLYRVTEAFLIYRQGPARKIIISGSGEVPGLMRELMVQMGVPEAAVSLDASAGNTCASAENLKPRLGWRRFFLVTSAGHMPRAVNCFEKMGANVIPAPTHFLSRYNPLATAYLPSPEHLRLSDLAIAEYAAMIWDQVASKPADED